MRKSEREAIGLFLHDLYHYKQVKKRMYEVADKFTKDELLAIVADLKEKDIIDDEEVKYLQNKINGLYGR